MVIIIMIVCIIVHVVVVVDGISQSCVFFCFNVTATTEIYTYCHTLSLHDALPISRGAPSACAHGPPATGPGHPGRPRCACAPRSGRARHRDRKSTRLNSSH